MPGRERRCGANITRRREAAREVRKGLQVYVAALEACIDMPDSAEAGLAVAVNAMLKLIKLHKESAPGQEPAVRRAP